MTRISHEPPQLSQWFETVIDGWLGPRGWDDPARCVVIELAAIDTDDLRGVMNDSADPAEWSSEWTAELWTYAVDGSGAAPAPSTWFEHALAQTPTTLATLSAAPDAEPNEAWRSWLG